MTTPVATASREESPFRGPGNRFITILPDARGTFDPKKRLTGDPYPEPRHALA